MSDLPSSWIKLAISEIAEVNPRKDVDLSTAELVSFVPMAAVDEVSGTIMSPVDRPYGEVSKGFTHFRDEDVIFAKITPSMENGKSAVARGLTNGTGMGSTEFHVFRSSGAVEPDYLWRFVRQRAFREDAQAVMSGAVGQQRVPADWLKEHLIPLPPLPEQRRILAKVDGLTARTVGARKELDRIPTLIARYKQRLLALALCGGLTADWRNRVGYDRWLEQGLQALATRRSAYEKSKRGSRIRPAPPLEAGEIANLPSSWISCGVADVADLRVGYAFKSQWFSSKGTRLIRGANVAPGRIDWSDEKRLSPEHIASYEDYRLATGDVVIAMDRPLISTGLKIAIVSEEDSGALLVQRVANPRPTPWLNAKYMFYLFNGQGFISQIENHATGSDLPHISGNDILTTAVPLPPFDEQAEIVRRIESAFGWLDRMAADHAAAARLLPKLDAAILAKAFQGKLVPQDPKDEPAAKLLERIKAEREAEGAKPKKGRGRPRQEGKVLLASTDVVSLPVAYANSSRPKGKPGMTKSRQDDDVKDKPYLAGLLKSGRFGDAQSLFRAADLPVADFYKQLAWEIDKGHILDSAEELKAA